MIIDIFIKKNKQTSNKFKCSFPFFSFCKENRLTFVLKIKVMLVFFKQILDRGIVLSKMKRRLLSD